MPYNAIAIRRKGAPSLGQVVDADIPMCIDTNTGMAIPCENNTWVGWSIILSAIGSAATTWAAALNQKQLYQQAGYQFPQLTQTSYDSQYNMIKSLHPSWTDAQIRQLLEPSSSTGAIPTWVWVGGALVLILILVTIMKKEKA